MRSPRQRVDWIGTGVGQPEDPPQLAISTLPAINAPTARRLKFALLIDLGTSNSVFGPAILHKIVLSNRSFMR
jgi:hypothetical protein